MGMSPRLWKPETKRKKTTWESQEVVFASEPSTLGFKRVDLDKDFLSDKKQWPEYTTIDYDDEGEPFYFVQIDPLVITQQQVGDTGLLFSISLSYSRVRGPEEESGLPIQLGDEWLETYFWIPP